LNKTFREMQYKLLINGLFYIGVIVALKNQIQNKWDRAVVIVSAFVIIALIICFLYNFPGIAIRIAVIAIFVRCCWDREIEYKWNEKIKELLMKKIKGIPKDQINSNLINFEENRKEATEKLEKLGKKAVDRSRKYRQ